MTTADATSPVSPTGHASRLASRAASAMFLASIVSLPFMQPPVHLLGSAVQIADVLFAVTGLLWLISLAAGAPLRKGRFYLLLGGFFGAMLITTALAPLELKKSAGRLVIEAYLLGLGVLAYNLVRSIEDLRRAWTAWTATALFTAACILVSVVLFYAIGLKSPDENLILWKAGSLPVGNYPRARGFFLNGNMTGDYLAVSACFAVGLAALSERHRRRALGAALAIAAASVFTLSTALGGLAIAVAMFAWLLQKSAGRAGWLKLLAPLAASFAALLLLVTAFSPKMADSKMVFEPSVRSMTWASSWGSFVAHPIFGNGLGVALADVRWTSPSGVHEHLTDPHNAWLSIGGQMGLVGLCAFAALLAWLLRGLRGVAIAGDPARIARAALLGALFVPLYQAMSCSLEDMRHVWILIGLAAGAAEGLAADPARGAATEA